VSGIKRHILKDTQGLPHVIHITTANVTDRKAAYVILKVPESSRLKVVNVLADGGIT
jgi:transposase